MYYEVVYRVDGIWNNTLVGISCIIFSVIKNQAINADNINPLKNSLYNTFPLNSPPTLSIHCILAESVSIGYLMTLNQTNIL